MASASWSDEEEEALRYLPHRAQVLYLRGLRRYMDFTTGIVGDRRRISLQQLRECLEVHPDRGSDVPKFAPSRDHIRADLALLVRAGLIQRLEKAHRLDPMRFFMPLASIRPNEEPQRNAHTATHIGFDSESYTCDTATPNERTYRNPIPPVLPENITRESARARRGAPITTDFQLDQHTLARLRMAGCQSPTRAELMLFVAEKQSFGWLSEDWQAEYLRWAIKNKTRSAGKPYPRQPRTGAEWIAALCGPGAFSNEEDL